jgi:hypothetical protein
MKDTYRIPKGEARMAVEEALQTGTRESPIDALAIASITGLSISLVRTHVNNCIERHLAHNVNTPGQVGAAYAWGMRPDSRKLGNVAQPRNGIPTGRYTGEKPIYTRPGSDDFLKLPSRRGDSTVEWERPFIISGRVEPVGVRG